MNNSTSIEILDNTRIESNEDFTVIFFRENPIVKFDEHTIKLDICSWYAQSTINRMNIISELYNLGYKVIRKGEYILAVEYKDQVIRFNYDGILTLTR